MRKKKERSLFDVIEESVEQDKPLEECSHLEEEKTLTVWPGEDFERMTWTCKRCGRIRGRIR